METESRFRTAQRAAIGEERRRMVRGRRYLQAALGHPSPDWSRTLTFIQSCVDHLRISVSRLVAQDLALADHLRMVMPQEEVDDREYLDEVKTRLTARKQDVADLVAASQILADAGPEGLADFSSAVDLFFHAPALESSRPEKHSLGPMIEAHGSPDAYEQALAAADACGSEAAAFSRVEGLAYPGLAEQVAAATEREGSARPRRGR